MNDTLINKAWFLACEAEGFSNEVPDWAIQMVSDTQLEIYNQLLKPWEQYSMTETEYRQYQDEYADWVAQTETVA
jgi:hypothetical protein